MNTEIILKINITATIRKKRFYKFLLMYVRISLLNWRDQAFCDPSLYVNFLWPILLVTREIVKVNIAAKGKIARFQANFGSIKRIHPYRAHRLCPGKDVHERSQTSERIVGISRRERQKHRPVDSRGRRAGRRPEKGRRRRKNSSETGMKSKIALLAIEGGKRRGETSGGSPLPRVNHGERKGSGRGEALIKPGSM